MAFATGFARQQTTSALQKWRIVRHQVADKSFCTLVLAGHKTCWAVFISVVGMFHPSILKRLGGSTLEPSNLSGAGGLSGLHVPRRGVERMTSRQHIGSQSVPPRGTRPAQNNLGQLDEHGFGVQKHHSAALNLYRQAAQQGLASAPNSLGAMYEAGLGV